MSKYDLITEVEIERFPLTNEKKQQISIEIERIYGSCPELTYLESMIIWANANDIEESDMSKCISTALKEKLYLESCNANLIKSKDATRTRSKDQWVLDV